MLKIINSRISIICISLIVSYFVSDLYENILGFILILSIGVVHGANDLLIINKYSKETPSSINSIFKNPIEHKLSHQKLIIQFWRIRLSDNSILPLEKENVFKFPVPVVIEKFMVQFYKTLT